MDNSNAERLVNSYSDMILRVSFLYLKQTCDAGWTVHHCRGTDCVVTRVHMAFDSSGLPISCKIHNDNYLKGDKDAVIVWQK